MQETVERQAAERLARAPGQEAVDNRRLLRWGYVLVAALAAGAVYALASPKNPFTTAARVLAPWANISAPTRVQITDVTPGSGEAIRGETLTVAAAVAGLRPDEQPELVVVSSGAPGAQERLLLTEADGLDRFTVEWQPTPTSDLADAEVRYRIEAGDARTPAYRLSLVTAPVISVAALKYDYQDYTGLLDRTAEGIGDIRAIEGTRVTIVAEANTPIAAAQVDLQGDGRPDIRMQADGRRAEATLTLGLREDRRTPKAASYVLRFTSADDRANTNPASYRIEVLPDQLPEATLLSPTEPVREVGIDEAVTIEAEARDPDFALSRVRFRGEVAGSGGLDVTLLDGAKSGPHEGRWTTRWRFVPREHNLRVGESVTYWIVAEDTRQPSPGVGVSDRRRLLIVDRGEAGGREQNERRPGEGKPDGNPENGQDQKGQGDQQGQGQQEKNGQDQGQRGQDQQGQGEQQPSEQAQPGDRGQDGDNSQPANDQPGAQQQEGQSGKQPQQGQPQQEAQQQGGEGEQQGQQQQGQQQEGQQQSGQSNNEGQDGQQGEDQQGGNQQGQGLPSDQRGQRGDQNQSGGGGQKSQDNGDQAAEPGDAQQRTGRQGENRQGGEDQASKPVSADGDDDGTAFDRIRQRLAEQQKEQEQQAGKQGDGKQESNQDGQPSGGNPGESAPNKDGGQEKSSAADPSSPNSPSGAGDTGSTDRQAADQQPERNDQGNPPGDAQPNNDRRQSDQSTSSGSGDELGNEDSAENETKAPRQPREGTGGVGKNEAADQGNGVAGDRGPGEDSPQGGDQRSAEDQAGKPGESERGAGQNRREGAGDEPGGKPRDSQGEGQQPSGGGEPNESTEPGERGAEPGEQQEGSNGAGEQSDATGDRTEGDGSRDATDSPSGDSRAGEPGGEQQRGKRSTSGDAESGESDGQLNPESQPGQSDPNRPGERPPTGDQQRDPSNQSRQPGNRNGNPGGNRPEGGIGADGESDTSSEPGGDDANLDYAREQTDLVLESLADQLARKQVDQEMLDELGWTEADMRRFVERWQARKQAAQQRGGQRQAELDKALRSLGLRPGELSGETGVAKDQMRDLRSGRRINVPAKFQDRLRRYNRGVSRAER
ncbi:MAG: hypothetical protein AAGJ46_13900 [Planctomycetota bacterium]